MSWFFLLHPTLPYFEAFILMKYVWMVSFLWFHMRSMAFLSLLLMMTWLEWYLIYIFSRIICYIMMIYIFMGALIRLLWATWSLYVFFAPYLVQILVEVLNSLLGWNNKWLIILMHITFFQSSIIGHVILNYVIVSYLI